MNIYFKVLTALLVSGSVTAFGEEFVFDGSQLNPTFDLSGQQTHDVYKDVPYEDTCYRTLPTTHLECNGTKNQCDPITRRVCDPPTQHRVCQDIKTCYRNLNGTKTCYKTGEHCSMEEIPGACRDVPDTYCHPVPNCYPVNDTEPYTCEKFRSVYDHTELDFDVRANIAVKFSDVPAGLKPNESLRVSFNGRETALDVVNSSGQLVLVELDESYQESVVSEKLKKVVSSYDVQLLSARDLTSTFGEGISQVAIHSGVLSFVIGRPQEQRFLKLHMGLLQSRFLGDKWLFDKDLLSMQYTMEPQGDKTLVKVSLNQLGVGQNISSGKYVVKLQLDLAGGLVNRVLNTVALPPRLSTGSDDTVKASK